MYDLECTYTHLLHAHFSAHSALTAYFAHLHACHIHACLKCHEKGVYRMSVISLHLAFSLLMSHPPLLFPHGHFETTPDNDFTDDPVHVFLPNFPVLKAQDMRNSAPASRSLATWPDQMQTHVRAVYGWDARRRNGELSKVSKESWRRL